MKEYGFIQPTAQKIAWAQRRFGYLYTFTASNNIIYFEDRKSGQKWQIGFDRIIKKFTFQTTPKIDDSTAFIRSLWMFLVWCYYKMEKEKF